MELSKRVMRQVENLSKTFDFDMKRRVAIIPLHFKTPEELIDIHLSSPGKPIVSDETVDYLCEVVSYIPKEFTVDIRLIIDDYGEYDHAALMNAMRATLEDTYYYYDENRKKDNVLAVFFLILGILMLALETVGGMEGWYGAFGSIRETIIQTILDVLVWVFAWEGAALLFLTYGNESTQFGKNMQRFNGIRFLNRDGEVLSCLDEEEFYKGWIYLSGKEAVARNYILFSSAALLAILSVLTVELFADLNDFTTLDRIGFFIGGILLVVLMISNIAFYSEKGRMGKYVYLFSLVCIIYSIFSVIYCVYWDGIGTTYSIVNIVLTVVLAINLICIRYMSKQNVEIK